MKPPGSSLCAYVLPAQAVSSLPDLLGHPSLQDIYLTLLIMVACFVVLYCEWCWHANLPSGAASFCADSQGTIRVLDQLRAGFHHGLFSEVQAPAPVHPFSF